MAIKWGMIGCGEVTEVKNGPGLYKCRDSRLVGVTNRTLSKAEDWVKRHRHGKVFAGVPELLACPDIDIVYVATTPDTHKEFALLCARAGKHCYLEKPIVHSYEDAVELQKAFDSAGKKIFVAHYRRGLPQTRKMKELIAKIAPVRCVRVICTDKGTIPGWRDHPEISGGGLFFEGGVHVVDLIDYHFGPLHDWNVDAVNYGGKAPAEDAVVLSSRG
ncbi:MAG: Gfo/Idh/MocA family oxidoreductase, partial [Spirochaetales bacterium]|nr:Gfo/Idh/MocA family oxidoreductase [Spirochaetales bacterium]